MYIVQYIEGGAFCSAQYVELTNVQAKFGKFVNTSQFETILILTDVTFFSYFFLKFI